jgi:photosystem II stability/assembly factor-like uncharacterized protein
MAITITPYNPPINIPNNGGIYQYTIQVDSNFTSPISFEIWTMYTLPNGSSYGPIFGPADFLIPDEWIAYKDDLIDYVDSSMPSGTYTYTTYVGTYDNDVWDTDSFTFEKIPSNGGWYPQNPGDVSSLEAVSFSDENNGWAVGYDTIIHTTNGGDTWFDQDDGIYYNQGYNAVDFIDSQTGWAAGSLIIKTTDGGNTWTEQYDPSSYSLNAIQFLDANKGWAAGGRYDTYNSIFYRVILYTSDGGDNWTTQLFESGYYYDPVGPFNDIYFIDSNHGWVAGDIGAIFSTSDGGANWIEQDSGLTGYYNDLYGIAFGDLNNGWAVGEDGSMVYTNDGGNTWSNYYLGFNDYLRSIVFTDSNNGWIAGGGYYPDHPTILHTNDGGSTWNIQDPGTGDFEYQLNDIEFVNQNMGWAAGRIFYPQKGVMLHTEDGGGIQTDPILSYNPSSIDFGDMYGAQEDNTTMNIWNSGTGTLTYYLYPEDLWITTDPEGGFSQGEQDIITVNIDTGGLQPGDYQTNITITSNDQTVLIPVYVTILQSNQILSFSPQSYDFGDMPQYQMETMNLSIWNSGTGTMFYWIDDFDTFCIVDPWSGSSQGEVNNHTVMCFTSPLDPGPHQCNLTIYSSGGNANFTVYVNVTSGGKNTPPIQPSDPLPTDASTIEDQNPVLSVLVTDPDSEMMTVTFYDSSDDSIIGTDYNVLSGTRAYTVWNDLSMNTTYSWYVNVHDEVDINQSVTWNFNTLNETYSDDIISTLSIGWNMVSTPFDQPVNIDDIIVYYNGINYTWSDATDPANGPIVDPNVYGWDRINQMYIPVGETLIPGYAYWMYSYHDCVLKRS